MRKARKIQGLCYFSCQTFIQSRSALSSPLWKRLDLDVMFTALVDFVEEPIGFEILYTTISLHVSFLMLYLQLISSLVYEGKVHTDGSS